MTAMNLKEWLDNAPNKNLIRLGAGSGGGFIYAGQVGDCDLSELDERNKAILQKITDRRKYQNGINPTQKNKELYQRSVESLENYLPLAKRQIKETYPSVKGKSTIIIFDGYESERVSDDIKLDGWDDETPTEYNTDAIKNLIAAVEKNAAEELRLAHLKLKDAQDIFMQAYQDAEKLENYLLDNGYGFLDDPEVLIDGIRKQVYGENKC